MKSIIVKNPNPSQVNILLPKFGIDLKLDPNSESNPLNYSTLSHLKPYISVFKLQVEVIENGVAAKSPEVVTTSEPKVEVVVPEVKEEVVEVEETTEAKDDVEEPSEYTLESLQNMYKNDLVQLCDKLGLANDGTKDELIQRIVDSQG